MAALPKRVCWDACTWIALIQKENVVVGGNLEDRYTMCRSVINVASNGGVEIIVSGLCFVEVCKNPGVNASSEDKIAAFFENDYIVAVAVDRYVGTRARGLMLAKYPGLKPPDAVHLATALITNADEFNTFDDALLALDGKVIRDDGVALKICKPGNSGPAMPLLDQAGV